MRGLNAAFERSAADGLSGVVEPALKRTLALAQIESTSYLRNQVLHDSDWASMGRSVEMRKPMVDAALIHELSPRMSALGRFPNEQLLARAPIRCLPNRLMGRPKTGFGIPVPQWLRQLHSRTSDPRPIYSWARKAAPRYAEAVG